jgi:hypothetical protein
MGLKDNEPIDGCVDRHLANEFAGKAQLSLLSGI